jgi:hypothetical protein
MSSVLGCHRLPYGRANHAPAEGGQCRQRRPLCTGCSSRKPATVTRRWPARWSAPVAGGAGVLAAGRFRPGFRQPTQAGRAGDDDGVPGVVAPDQAEVLQRLEVTGEVVRGVAALALAGAAHDALAQPPGWGQPERAFP